MTSNVAQQGAAGAGGISREGRATLLREEQGAEAWQLA